MLLDFSAVPIGTLVCALEKTSIHNLGVLHSISNLLPDSCGMVALG